jgi:hypothetical protein
MMRFKLPLGGKTNDAVEYSKAWRDLAKPIETITNYKMVSFDPNLQFHNDDDSDNFELSVKVAKLLGDSLREKQLA